jgi:hypothetical protein
MAQMIEMFKNDYLKNSIQQTIDIIQKKDDIKQVKTLEKKINEIYNNGCLYKKDYEGKPEIRTFLEIFKIPKHVNPIDIVTLFFPLSFIKNTTTTKISRPTILEQKPKTGGGVQMLSKDNRRLIYALNIEELDGNEAFNDGRFVMKIALSKHYSQAYDVEGQVYNGMKNCKNVVKMYRAGKFDNENDFFDNNSNKINMKKLLNTALLDDNKHITLPNANIYRDMSFLVLEHCFDHKTLCEYVRGETEDDNGTRSYKAFKKTMIAVQELNTKVGFFHGDLHTDNVLIRENGEDIKLFDFDFSALLGKQIISNNLLLYNLTWKPCAHVNEDCTLFIEENNVVKVQPKIDKTDFNINEFMFIFDYFRLLFSILKKRRISYEIISDYPEFENISRNIILWYTNLDKTKDNDWNCHFKGNVFLPIYNFIRSDKEHIKKTNEELNKQYKEFQQKILQGKFVKTESDMSSFFDNEIKSSNNGSKGGGNKLKKKYTRLGRAHINKDNKRTSRVIYKSGNGYYIRDVKGIYTLVKKKDLTFA